MRAKSLQRHLSFLTWATRSDLQHGRNCGDNWFEGDTRESPFRHAMLEWFLQSCWTRGFTVQRKGRHRGQTLGVIGVRMIFKADTRWEDLWLGAEEEGRRNLSGSEPGTPPRLESAISRCPPAGAGAALGPRSPRLNSVPQRQPLASGKLAPCAPALRKPQFRARTAPAGVLDGVRRSQVCQDGRVV